MKKQLTILIIAFLLGGMAIAQEYPGIHSSRYFPLQNINNQPADLVRDSTKWHINVVTTQISLMRNFAFQEDDMLDLLGKAGFTDLKHFLATEQSNLYIHGILMLPSVSYKINKNHAVALWFDMRAHGIYRASNDEFLKLFSGVDAPEDLAVLADEYFKAVINSWMEYNLTYSGVIWETPTHKVTAGITFKYLEGGGSGYFNMDGVDVSYNKDNVEYFRMDLSYALSESLSQAIHDDKIELFGDTGFGLSFGANYTYKPDHLKNVDGIPYKFKVGASVKDLGSIKHKSSVSQKKYRLSVEDVPYSRFKGIESLEGLVDSLKQSFNFDEIEGGSYRMDLPTKYTATGDYCFRKHWFLHGSISFQPDLYSKVVKILKKDVWDFKLTPRFENQTWGVYLPVSYMNQLGWRAGLGLRWKYLFMGSGTVLSNMIDDEKGMGQFYFGANIPIGKR